MVGFQWAQCRRVRPVLWDYASERLPERAMELAEQHLQKCESCRAEVGTLQRAHQFLSACRAEEEPRPRSNWDTLRRRITAEGVTPMPQTVFASANDASAAGTARRGLRVSWPMQLAATAAGGFAAVLTLGAFTRLPHAPAVLTTQAAPLVTASVSPRPVPGVQTPAIANNSAANAPQYDAAQTALIAGVVHALNGVRTQPETTVAPEPSASQVTVAAAPAGSGSDNAARAAVYTARPHSISIPASGKERALRVAKNTLPRPERMRFQPYTPKPQERLQAVASASETASHYALERVRSVNSESDEAGAYVVGSVRPVSYEESGDY